MLELRNNQMGFVAGLRGSFARGNRAVLGVAPTGFGKTCVFSYLAARLVENRKRLVILNHREELTEQISRTLHQFNVGHGIIAAGMQYDRRPLAHVASVFTLARRLDTTLVPDYVVIDEAHHCISGSTWGKVIERWRACNAGLKVIGVTATPERLSGEGLGQVFDDMVMGPTTAELIAAGWLAPYRLFAPPIEQQADLSGVHTKMGEFARGEAAAAVDKPAIIGSAVSHYRKYLDGAPAVAFCASIAHAQHVAEQFRAEGFRAASIDGGMEKDTRRSVVRDFASGQLNVMTSCDLVSEGFDIPGMVGAIMLRPTQSLALYLQQVGRALRICPGKSSAVLLDHVGNSARHGLPDDEREWSLAGRDRKSKADRDPDDVAIKQCKACFAISRATAAVCRECGKPFIAVARKVEEKEGELQEVDPAVARAEFMRSRAAAADIESLTQVGRMRGMKNPAGWAAHVIEAREAKKRGRAA